MKARREPAGVERLPIADIEIRIVEGVKAAWDQHAGECGRRPKAILLNDGNYRLVGWNELLGVPVLPDRAVEPMRFLLVCGSGRGGYCAEGDVVWDDAGATYVRVSSQ